MFEDIHMGLYGKKRWGIYPGTRLPPLRYNHLDKSENTTDLQMTSQMVCLFFSAVCLLVEKQANS